LKGSLFAFGERVVAGFQRSHGFLLAGAAAYYTLLAIVPLFVVLLVGCRTSSTSIGCSRRSPRISSS
jgi:uncharacterized BrkB/YihY/UPF0761 family membrane protein